MDTLAHSSGEIVSLAKSFITPNIEVKFMKACPSLSPPVCSNSCPWSWRCHLTISSSATPFSSYPSGSFSMSQMFISSGQSIGGSASASVLPINI